MSVLNDGENKKVPLEIPLTRISSWLLLLYLAIHPWDYSPITTVVIQKKPPWTGAERKRKEG